MAVVLAPRAGAAGLETLLMPGKVSSAHAKIEQDCSQCHDRANRSRQAALCVNCHKDVGADLRAHTGFHGRLPAIDRAQCSACHTEHLGRDAGIVKFSPAAFDHSQADFPLQGAHAAAPCAGCHAAGKKYREAPTACVACHRADDAHGGALGTDCAACHAPARWSEARFDHARTRFALTNRHQQVPCAACHFGNRYGATPTQCASCHAPDDVHRGSRGQDCASCHTTVGWKGPRFDHLKQTGFALTGAHGGIDCQACHRTGNLQQPVPKDCVGCHRADDAHAGRFADRCDRCHSTGGWTPVAFDHARDGHFALVGAHAKLGCHDCHSAPLATQKLGTACIACHRSRDVHGGQLGTDCSQCHGTETWRGGLAFDHDLTPFPLVGLHVAVPCARCHTTPVFKGVPTGCDDCHRREDRHKGSLGRDCEACHSPSGWTLWQFDHAKTGFALQGAHARATCEGCHRQPPETVKLATDCASCHSQDDKHLGSFGRQCQRCHGTSTFKGARLQ